ncbi:MAG: MscL family protein [Candidatus Sigynarchaeota archaeon]
MSEEAIVEELRQIKKLLEPKPPAPPSPPKNLMLEFKDFLKNYKVLGLAVAFIIGLYLGGLVQALVKDLLLPLIGLLIPGLSDLASLKVSVLTQEFLIGDFLSALITFIIVAFVIFLIVKVTKRFGIE